MTRLLRRIARLVGHAEHERPPAVDERAARSALGYSPMERQVKATPCEPHPNPLRAYLAGQYDADEEKSDE